MQVNWLTFIVGAIALYVGYRLNQYANTQSEKKIIDALTAEIESIKSKQQLTRGINPEDQSMINLLQAQIDILGKK